MKILSTLLLIFSLSVTYVVINGFENPFLFGNEQVAGYHFHSYYYQNNPKSILEADTFRETILGLIKENYFENCILSIMFPEPGGLHPIGNFITCCNATSMWRALPWFMQNHGNLSVLLHPLTKKALSDHTERAMFLGRKVPLDFTRDYVPNNLTTVFRCIVEDLPRNVGVPIWV